MDKDNRLETGLIRISRGGLKGVKSRALLFKTGFGGDIFVAQELSGIHQASTLWQLRRAWA